MGRGALSCCALAPLGSNRGRNILEHPIGAKSSPSDSWPEGQGYSAKRPLLDSEAKDFVQFVAQASSGLPAFLEDLAQSAGDTVYREAFRRHALNLGYPGDAGLVFDSLDAGGAGILSLDEIRERLAPATGATSRRSRSKAAKKNSGGDPEGGETKGSPKDRVKGSPKEKSSPKALKIGDRVKADCRIAAGDAMVEPGAQGTVVAVGARPGVDWDDFPEQPTSYVPQSQLIKIRAVRPRAGSKDEDGDQPARRSSDDDTGKAASDAPARHPSVDEGSTQSSLHAEVVRPLSQGSLPAPAEPSQARKGSKGKEDKAASSAARADSAERSPRNEEGAERPRERRGRSVDGKESPRNPSQSRDRSEKKGSKDIVRGTSVDSAGSAAHPGSARQKRGSPKGSPRGSPRLRKSNPAEEPPQVLKPPITSGMCFVPSSVVEPILVKAPLAGDASDINGDPLLENSSYAMFRPLPYEPVPSWGDDDNRLRTFIFKGRLVKVPLLNLHKEEDVRGGTKNAQKLAEAPAAPAAAAAPAKAANSRAWQVVKSKVVGGPAMAVVNESDAQAAP